MSSSYERYRSQPVYLYYILLLLHSVGLLTCFALQSILSFAVSMLFARQSLLDSRDGIGPYSDLPHREGESRNPASVASVASISSVTHASVGYGLSAFIAWLKP